MAVVVDSIEAATAPQMLWGRRKKPKTKPRQVPTDLPQHVYLFECSFDSSIVIGGITCQLTERKREQGYGRLLWSCQLPSRNACRRAERRFLQITSGNAVGPGLRGRTTWTEARQMSAVDAIAAWQRAIGKQHENGCTTYQ